MTNVAQLYESSEITSKRELILQAALELFTERGFHGTAIPLVAEKAGVGAGTIYRYFPSKEALVNTLYRDWKEFQIRKIKGEAVEDTSLRAQFRIYWNRMIRFALDHPTAFSFLMLHFHAPYLDEDSLALEESGRQALLAFFNECRRQQVVKDLPSDFLGSLVWGTYVGFIKGGRTGVFPLNQEMIDKAEECCWEAIRC